MSTVRLSDVIVPEKFGSYMRMNTKENSLIFRSGILENDESLAGFMAGGGTLMNLPFWRDLSRTTGAAPASDDPTVKSTPDKIQAGKMAARRIYRTKSWSSMNLAGVLAGADPMARIQERVANWWDLEFQETLVAVLKGVMLDNVANDNSDMVVRRALPAGAGTISDANLFDPDVFIDAKQTLGDAGGDIGIVIMHSVIASRLEKAEKIEFIRPSQNDTAFGGGLGDRMYGGKYHVVVSDQLTAAGVTVGGVPNTRYEYLTIFCGTGAVKWNETPAAVPVQTWSDPASGNGSGEELLYTRRQFVLHPYGFRYTQAVEAASFPTNAELAQAANWDRVASERKQIPLAFAITNG